MIVTHLIQIGLCECGVNPEALALVVKELRRESASIQVCSDRYEQQNALQALDQTK